MKLVNLFIQKLIRSLLKVRDTERILGKNKIPPNLVLSTIFPKYPVLCDRNKVQDTRHILKGLSYFLYLWQLICHNYRLNLLPQFSLWGRHFPEF